MGVGDRVWHGYQMAQLIEPRQGPEALDRRAGMFILASRTHRKEGNSLRIVITGGGGLLAGALTTHLQSVGHEVRSAGPDEASVLDIDAIGQLCAGADRIVHLARAQRDPSAPVAEEDGRILDTALKGTWNVLQAAREAGVRQVVQISDVCVYSGYDPGTILSEDMVALPDTSAEQQALHLAEGVAHEFASETPGFVLTLRLGRLVEAASLAASAPFDPDWLDVDDAVAAVTRGFELESYDHPKHWGLYNLVADTPFRRFALRIKGGSFSLTPTVDFHDWWPDEQKGAP
ncbi:MAG: hypothetical protein CME04_14230 [Gemmatimonadaceae bacterium]|nr:hypothetical protein [Gemmatimonadaceae bacterium]